MNDPLLRRRAQEARVERLRPGVYRHYKGNLYQAVTAAHDANDEERIVVIYVGLQLDKAHTGPRFAVRSIEDFQARLCKTHGWVDPDECHDPEQSQFCEIEPRFDFLGYFYEPWMDSVRPSSPTTQESP